MMAEHPVVVRYAQTDDDVVAVHRFLCIVAGPRLPHPINPEKSATEVWRVVNDDVALMAMVGDVMVGTLGLVCQTYWWGDRQFLANRWLFALPGAGAWRPLLSEARAIAVGSEMECLIISEERGRLFVLNKNVKRTSRHVLRRQLHREKDRHDADVDPARVAH